MSKNSWFLGGMWAGSVLSACIIGAIMSAAQPKWLVAGFLSAFMIWTTYVVIEGLIAEAKKEKK